MIQPRTLFLAIATSLALGVTAGPVHAQPADSSPPSAADIEAAKKAFGEGKAAFDAKKFGEAVEKFKESYRLSKRPTLLYNIALALDENKQPDMALFYYKKFMADAPSDDAQRPLADARIKALSPAPATPTTGTGTGTPASGIGTGTPTTAEPVKPKPRTAGPIVVAPAGTYSANDFQHRIVDEAPPGKALDITATVPTDSGFAVTLYYRGAGEANFTAVPMKWRYNELVGRIPAAKMNGTSVQYYLEVKDQAGTMITKVAKPASPNLIYMEANAKSNLYPDWDYDSAKLTAVPESGKVVDDTTPTTTTTTTTDDNPLANDTSDDPLAGGDDTRVAEVTAPTPELTTPGGRDDGGGGGFMDVGSTKFNVVKWGATGVAVAAFVGAGVFYNSATESATTLEEEADAADCFGNESPPCTYDEYLRDTESSGKLNEKLFYVSLGVGAVVGGVAIYYWIKELKGSAVREAQPATTGRGKKKKSRTFIAAPAIGDGLLGGTAAWEW